jgi:hypothetical protein
MRETCDALNDVIRSIDEVTAALVRAVRDIAAIRCATPDRAARLKRINTLIDAQAWTDAALAIAALDHAYAVRRIERDDGEWHCTIGSQWRVPAWLDRGTWYSHSVLPLAIIGAMVEALGQGAPAAHVVAMPNGRSNVRDDVIAPVDCDNYA